MASDTAEWQRSYDEGAHLAVTGEALGDPKEILNENQANGFLRGYQDNH